MYTMSATLFDGFLEEEKNGNINVRQHPKNNDIVILSYSKSAVIDRHWNYYTMLARGLIIDKSTYNQGHVTVLSKPFEKFFNLNENMEYQEDIDLNNIVSVAEKLDGSLGISYMLDGKLSFATKGSFESEQAIRANDIWERKYQHANEKYMSELHSRPTLLVEIIYPENRIVVDYQDREELVLLGVMDGNHDYSYELVSEVGELLGMTVAKNYKYSLDEMVDMKETISSNVEGWIVRFNDNKRLKIKGDEYLSLHRARYSSSNKSRALEWSQGNQREVLESIPEEFRGEVDTLFESLDNAFNDKLEEVLKICDNYKNIEDRPSLAEKVTKEVSKDNIKYVFLKFDGKDIEGVIKKDIARNYRDYI